MGVWSLTEKVIAGVIVFLIGAAATYLLWPKVGSWWRLRRRMLVSGGGDTGRTYVSAGVGADGDRIYWSAISMAS